MRWKSAPSSTRTPRLLPADCADIQKWKSFRVGMLLSRSRMRHGPQHLRNLRNLRAKSGVRVQRTERPHRRTRSRPRQHRAKPKPRHIQHHPKRSTDARVGAGDPRCNQYADQSDHAGVALGQNRLCVTGFQAREPRLLEFAEVEVAEFYFGSAVVEVDAGWACLRGGEGERGCV